MKTYVIYSHDANEEECTITVRCETEDQARQIASAAALTLRQKGILRGGSKVEKEDESDFTSSPNVSSAV